jgi:hypothetical protein
MKGYVSEVGYTFYRIKVNKREGELKIGDNVEISVAAQAQKQQPTSQSTLCEMCGDGCVGCGW